MAQLFEKLNVSRFVVSHSPAGAGSADYRDGMSNAPGPSGLVHEARELAHAVLMRLPERWRHSIGVALRAEQVVGAITADRDRDREVIVAAAWLHDIGYADTLRVTGFHPLDGARFLLKHGWSMRLAGLVAHHSEASSAARVRGLADELADFDKERSPDTLTPTKVIHVCGMVLVGVFRCSPLFRDRQQELAVALFH